MALKRLAKLDVNFEEQDPWTTEMAGVDLSDSKEWFGGDDLSLVTDAERAEAAANNYYIGDIDFDDEDEYGNPMLDTTLEVNPISTGIAGQRAGGADTSFLVLPKYAGNVKRSITVKDQEGFIDALFSDVPLTELMSKHFS